MRENTLIVALESPVDQAFVACVPWHHRETATPIRDIQCVLQLGIDIPIRIFVGPNAFGDLMANSNKSDIGGRENKFDCEQWQLLCRAEIPDGNAVVISSNGKYRRMLI